MFLVSLQLVYGLMINYSVNVMAHHITQIKEQYTPLTKKITLITEHQFHQSIEFERAFRYALEQDVEPNAQAYFTHSVEQFKQLSILFGNDVDDALKHLANDIEIASNPRSKKEFLTLSQHIKAIKKEHDKWDSEVDSIFSLLRSQDIKGAIDESEAAELHLNELNKDVSQILHEIEEFTEHAVISLEEEDQSIFNTGILMLVVSIAISFLLAKIITSNMEGNLAKLKESVDRIARGDLHTKAHSKLAIEFIR